MTLTGLFAAADKFCMEMLLLQRTVHLHRLIHVSQKFIVTHSHKVLYRMSNAYFRYNKDENQLIINLRYRNPDIKIDRDFNFCRNPSENIELFLERMKNNLEKEISKKLKPKKKKQEKVESESQVPLTLPTVSVELLKGANVLSNITFLDLFKDLENKEVVILKVLSSEFQVTFNQPWVLNVSLPSSILAGFEVYPNKMEIQFGSKTFSKGVWFKGRMVSIKYLIDYQLSE